MDAVDGATTRIGSDGGEERGIGDAKAHFLAFHVAAGLQRGGVLVNSLQQGIASGLGPIRRRNTAQEESCHRRPHRPAMALRSGHSPQCVSKAGRNSEDGKHLQQVAKWGGVLKGMGTVGIEESAAVRAQHLDRLLRGNRPLRNGLVGYGIHHRFAIRPNHRLAVRSRLLDLLRFDQLRGVVRLKILHDSLRYQDQGIDDARGQQHP